MQRAFIDLHFITKAIRAFPIPRIAEDFRVQRANMQAGAVQRQAGGDQPPNKLLVQRQKVILVSGLTQQPILDISMSQCAKRVQVELASAHGGHEWRIGARIGIDGLKNHRWSVRFR